MEACRFFERPILNSAYEHHVATLVAGRIGPGYPANQRQVLVKVNGMDESHINTDKVRSDGADGKPTIKPWPCGRDVRLFLPFHDSIVYLAHLVSQVRASIERLELRSLTEGASRW